MGKCAVTDDPKTCKLCDRLAEYVENPNPKGKGMKEFILTNFETGQKRWAFIAYTKSAKDRGVIMNFCPWCGESLLSPETKAEYMEVGRGE